MKHLTVAELTDMAGILSGTTGDPFELARQRFGKTFRDEDYRRLARHAGLFQCDVCSRWKATSEIAPGKVWTCKDDATEKAEKNSGA
jgi:hypothetical protein